MTTQSEDSYSHRAIWRIAAPMIASGISVPLLGMVDTAVVGHLDDAVWLASVAAGSSIFSTIFLSLNFLRMGTTGIASQAMGAGDYDGSRSVLAHSSVIAVVLGLLMILLQQPTLSAALQLINPGDNVAAATAQYFNIRVWAAPATLLNFAAVGWFLGMQNARAPLAIMLVINFSNIVLDLIFVPVLGMTADGVALASLIAEHTGLLLAVYLVRQELKRYAGHWRPDELFRLASYSRLLRVNSHLFIRSVALLFTFAFITARGARLGELFLAANAVLMNLQFFLSHALDGIAHAAEALCGKTYGSGDLSALKKVIRRTLHWSLGFAALYALVYLLTGEQIIGLITDIPEVRETAIEYLPWLIVSPLISVWSFLYDGVFVGLTRSKEMRNVMLGSLLLVFLPTWYLSTALGNHGLWLAFTAFMAARGIAMWWVSRSILESETA